MSKSKRAEASDSNSASGRSLADEYYSSFGPKRVVQLVAIMLFWFVISFISNILGPLIPDIIKSFNLTKLALAGFIPSSFFVSYAVMSIPAGILVERWGERVVLSIGFTMPLIGSLLFAWQPTYPVLLASCFIIGLGTAMLQTVLNPLQRVVGGEENYAFVGEVGQLVFSTASFLSPLVFSYFVANPMSIAPAGMPWVSLYYLFALLFLAMLGVVAVVRFPKINITEERLSGSASKSSFMQLLSQRKVWLFFFAIFCYTSFEQSLSVYMSTFLERYHSIDPHTEGAAAVSRFWGAMFLGCLAGLLLLKLIDSKLLLKIACACAAILVGLGIFGAAKIALIALPAIGFTMAMMFPILFSLALNSVESHHGQFAGILCSAIVGGAIGPLLVSIVGDITKSLRIGMLLTYIYLGYILFMAFWARPIIKNKLVGRKGAVASE